jgi:hypothetical protein
MPAAAMTVEARAMPMENSGWAKRVEGPRREVLALGLDVVLEAQRQAVGHQDSTPLLGMLAKPATTARAARM